MFAKPETLSQISRDIGQVFFASMFVGPVVSGSFDTSVVVAGFIFTLLAWYVSLLFAKI
ncbi:MAG: hypothetical protein HYY92_03190 [Parcubacteria group bacterium]|nr:hypothetical protein [Parcubacteria group bacterium]